MHAQLGYGLVIDLASLKPSTSVLCCVGSVFWVIVLLHNEVPLQPKFSLYVGRTECFS